MATPLNPKVTELVRRQIEKNYETPTSELHEAAIKIDPSLKKRSGLSFFASYVLPARRAENTKRKGAEPAPAAAPAAAAPVEKKRRGRPPKSAASPESSSSRVSDKAPVASTPVQSRGSSSASGGAEDLIRRTLTEVATDAMRAESRAEFLDLLARIDRHARDLAGALGSKR